MHLSRETSNCAHSCCQDALHGVRLLPRTRCRLERGVIRRHTAAMPSASSTCSSSNGSTHTQRELHSESHSDGAGAPWPGHHPCRHKSPATHSSLTHLCCCSTWPLSGTACRAPIATTALGVCRNRYTSKHGKGCNPPGRRKREGKEDQIAEQNMAPEPDGPRTHPLPCDPACAGAELIVSLRKRQQATQS